MSADNKKYLAKLTGYTRRRLRTVSKHLELALMTGFTVSKLMSVAKHLDLTSITWT